LKLDHKKILTVSHMAQIRHKQVTRSRVLWFS